MVPCIYIYIYIYIYREREREREREKVAPKVYGIMFFLLNFATVGKFRSFRCRSAMFVNIDGYVISYLAIPQDSSGQIIRLQL